MSIKKLKEGHFVENENSKSRNNFHVSLSLNVKNYSGWLFGQFHNFQSSKKIQTDDMQPQNIFVTETKKRVMKKIFA